MIHTCECDECPCETPTPDRVCDECEVGLHSVDEWTK